MLSEVCGSSGFVGGVRDLHALYPDGGALGNNSGPEASRITQGEFLRGAEAFFVRQLVLTVASGIWNLQFGMRLCRAVGSVEFLGSGPIDPP
jgi:hypothetical protein